MGISFKFKCRVCDVQCIDTRQTKEPDELLLALSPWLSLCTQHEKEYFDSKRFGYTAEKLTSADVDIVRSGMVEWNKTGVLK